jgi:pimeloyl-ACP methyl ester carboxylesterase
MPHFASYDGTRLAYHVTGSGDPLVCLPGGPARASRYLGDLGGLSATRTLIRLDLRGSGDSAVPGDPETYRCDRLVADVDALREHLKLARMDLLAHSAAGNLAVLYAARHPERLHRLVLVTPGLAAAGVELTDEQWQAVLHQQSGQPWYQDAYAAIMAWDGGDDRQEIRTRSAPFFYGRWDAATIAHAGADFEERAPAAAAGYYGDGAFEPARTRAELARLAAPTLVLAGGVDPAPTVEAAAELAKLFPRGELAVEPEAAHYPWITHSRSFARTVEGFLSRP